MLDCIKVESESSIIFYITSQLTILALNNSTVELFKVDERRPIGDVTDVRYSCNTCDE